MSPPPIVTALYVPGDRPDRFDKAVASGAHLVIVDLEDAVAPDRKRLARDAAAQWLTARAGDDTALVEVRVNAGNADDLATLVAARREGGSFGVRVPKVEAGTDIDAVAAALPGVALTALIETARGVLAAAEIAAHQAVDAVNLGEADLASDLGGTDQGVLDWARITLLYAARAAGLPAPMMSVFPDIGDLAGLRADTERGRKMGFIGRTAIHPSQVAVIAEAFTPGDDELRWAGEVVAAVAGGGVTRLANGEMVDPAMLGRANALLDLARACSPPR